MRIIFMGSAGLSCPSLQALLCSSTDKVSAVVTQPDRPKGRNLKSSPGPVKILAEDAGIPVLTPLNVNSGESLEQIKSFQSELIVVVAYGQILKPAILALPPMGCVNVHASLLPKYRGAAPIQWAIADGRKVSGVTTMFMVEKMDAGDIILQRESVIETDDTAGILHDRLAEEGSVLLIETLDVIRRGEVVRIPQLDAEATFARKLTKEDGRIDWTKSATEIYNRVRGFNPWPVCWCERGGSRQPEAGPPLAEKSKVESQKTEGVAPSAKLRVLRVGVEDGAGLPGEVIDVEGDGPVVAAGEKAVRLIEVQPENGKVMSGADYLRGHGLAVGEFLRAEGCPTKADPRKT
jgi:methionyl-tRNA formyltransferase